MRLAALFGGARIGRWRGQYAGAFKGPHAMQMEFADQTGKLYTAVSAANPLPMILYDAFGNVLSTTDPTQIEFAPTSVIPASGATVLNTVLAEFTTDGYGSVFLYVTSLFNAQVQMRGSVDGLTYSAQGITGSTVQSGSSTLSSQLGTVTTVASLYQFPAMPYMRLVVSTAGDVGATIVANIAKSRRPYIPLGNLGNNAEGRSRSGASQEIGGYTAPAIRARASQRSADQKVDAAFDASSGALFTAVGASRVKNYTPVPANESVAASTDITLVAAGGSSTTIRVHYLYLVSDTDVLVTLKSNATARRFISLKAGEPLIEPLRAEPYIECATNVALVLSRGVSCKLTYHLETLVD